jgi:hypothetical protein
MIDNATELKVAVRNLRILEEALRALRDQLEKSNPWLLAITSKAYLRRIASLQADIAKYLGEHPQEVSLVLPPLEAVLVAVMDSSPTPPC